MDKTVPHSQNNMVRPEEEGPDFQKRRFSFVEVGRGVGGGVKDLKLKSKSDKGIMKTCMKEVP